MTSHPYSTKDQRVLTEHKDPGTVRITYSVRVQH